MTSLILSEIFPPRVGGSGQWLHELYSRQAPERTLLLVGIHEGANKFDKASPLRIVRADLSGSAWTLMTGSGRAYLRDMYQRVKELNRSHSLEEIHCARVIPEGVVGWFASVFLRMRLVCFIHGEDIELALESRESRWLVARVLARSARLVCNSRNTRQLLINAWGCDKRKIVVLNPGVDTKLFRPATDQLSLKASLGWATRSVILTVSRLEARKGHDMMIEALPALIARTPDLLYAIVGSGEERASLEARVSALNLDAHVDFRGACDDTTLRTCLQACDVFVLPNRRIGSSIEGFGIVLLEAQACGKPVIAGDSGGTSETMIPGETGFVIDCTKPGNLVEPISRIIEDGPLRKRMGASARELMVKRFDWEALVSEAGQAVFVDAVSRT